MGVFDKFRKKGSLEKEMEEYKQRQHTTSTAYMEKGVMEVQDVFFITGRGTVVTGVISRGVFKKGDMVSIMRQGSVVVETQIEGIEAFRKLKDEAYAGENIGLLLRNIEHNVIQQNDIIESL